MFDTEGFCWLTHLVDYENVPGSLCIVCVFDTDVALANARVKGVTRSIPDLVEIHLEKVGFVMPQIENAVFFDTEESGADVNATRWCRKYSMKV